MATFCNKNTTIKIATRQLWAKEPHSAALAFTLNKSLEMKQAMAVITNSNTNSNLIET
jgi:hypothetical protein